MRFVFSFVTFRIWLDGLLFLLKKSSLVKVLLQNCRHLLNLRGQFSISPRWGHWITHFNASFFQWNDCQDPMEVPITIYMDIIYQVPRQSTRFTKPFDSANSFIPILRNNNRIVNIYFEKTTSSGILIFRITLLLRLLMQILKMTSTYYRNASNKCISVSIYLYIFIHVLIKN